MTWLELSRPHLRRQCIEAFAFCFHVPSQLYSRGCLEVGNLNMWQMPFIIKGKRSLKMSSELSHQWDSPVGLAQWDWAITLRNIEERRL